MRDPLVRECDVLIVGGGPTGLVLACLLAMDGVDVAVLERRTQPRRYSRAIGLHPPALAVLHSLGLEGYALDEGTAVRGGTAYSRGRPLGGLSFEQAWPDRPFVLTLPQNRTEQLLAQRLAQLAPRALRTGWEVTDVSEASTASSGTQRRVEVTAHPTIRQHGETAPRTSWQAKIVVGADGPHSLVRQISGIATSSHPLKDAYIMGDFAQHTHPLQTGGQTETTAALFLEPTGVVESFPLPGHMRRWVVHTGAELLPESPLELTTLIADRTGQFVDPTTATMISSFHVRRRLAQHMAVDRSLIIGDAAHEVSPIGGQGMTLGWLDALEVAPLLTQASKHNYQLPLQLQENFLVFERRRLAVAQAAAWQAELNMSLGRPMPFPVLTVRDAVLRRLLKTRIRHRLARAFTMRKPLGGPEIRVPG